MLRMLKFSGCGIAVAPTCEKLQSGMHSSVKGRNRTAGATLSDLRQASSSGPQFLKLKEK